MKTTPLAVRGRWRQMTIPAVVTRVSCAIFASADEERTPFGSDGRMRSMG
jgi:hypothetical protein